MHIQKVAADLLSLSFAGLIIIITKGIINPAINKTYVTFSDLLSGGFSSNICRFGFGNRQRFAGCRLPEPNLFENTLSSIIFMSRKN